MCRLEHVLAVFFNQSFVNYGEGIWGRRDDADRGPEYRALIGLPGGVKGPYMRSVTRANLHGMRLVEGKGSDPDSLFDDSVYIMDSAAFPFTQAEVCMQFHDDPPGLDAPFPPAYHALRDDLLHRSKIHQTMCPPNYVCGSP